MTYANRVDTGSAWLTVAVLMQAEGRFVRYNFLGGARRLVNEFDLWSKVGEGTRVTVTKWK